VCVHGPVGGFERGTCIAAAPDGMNAESDFKIDHLALPFERVFGNGLGEKFRFAASGVFIGVRQHNAELITPKSADNVGFTDIGGKNFRDLQYGRIARRVAPAVIDLLQTVQVQIDHARRRAVAFGIGQVARQFADEGAPVGDGCEGILIRELL
jgi:hypothetical protein